MKKRNIDFTKGSIIRQLILFAIPIILGELLQNLYNSVDAMVVGRYIGKSGLASISACAPISRLVINFFNGVSVGGGVVVGRAFGADKPIHLAKTKRVVFSFSILLGAVISCLGVGFTPVLLRISGVPQDIFQMAQSYLRIYLAGALFTVTYNIAAGIVRAIGDSRTPFLILTGTCVLNAFLDVLFVMVFQWGIVGAAIATLLSQATSLLLIVLAIRRKDVSFRVSFSELLPNRTIVADLISIGIPAGLQSAIIAVSNMFVWRYINGFGEAAIAGIGTEIRIEKLITSPASGFSHALTTCISQNEGASQHDRSRKGSVQCLLMAAIFTLSGCLLLSFFAESLAKLFSTETEVVSITVAMLHVMIPFYIVLVLRDVVMGMLRGYGLSKIPMYINILGMVVLRQIYLAVVMRVAPYLVNLYYCYPFSWMITLAMLIVYSLIVRKKDLVPSQKQEVGQ